jgi:putative Holliday junction resolvase
MVNNMITENLQEFYYVASAGSIMSIDYGAKKTGIAFSDSNRLMSFPVCVISAKSVKDCISQIKKVIDKKLPKSIVLGLPLYLNGNESKQTNITRKFAQLLFQETNLPIFLQDERLSTKGAESYLKDFHFNRKEREKISDGTSASLILEIVLNRLKNTN